MTGQACSCQTHDAPRLAAVLAPLDDRFPTPEYPPDEWFDRPAWLEPGQRLTVTDDGQVAGYFYEQGQCIVGMSDACPEPSPTGYLAFHQQHVVAASGDQVRVGAIGNVGGHASPYAPVGVAAAHYSDPNRQMIVCRAFDDEHGGYIAGALVPGLSYGDVALIRRSALSGDWRPMPRQWFAACGVHPNTPQGYDCVGPTLVTRPGLPLIQSFAASVGPPVLIGGCGGVCPLENEGTEMIITMPDGTSMELTAAEIGEAVMAHVARQAASPPPPPAAGDTPPPADDSTPDTEIAAQVAELQNVVGQLADAVNGLLAWKDEQMAAQVAAMDAELIALPEVDAVA